MVRGSAVTPNTRSVEHIPRIQRSPSRIQVAITTSGRYLTLLYNFWEQVQTSHCGQYSVERMLAFEEYCQRASPARVLIVCIAMPLPTMFMVLLAECLPLRPATDGALANYVFWIRHAAMVVLILLGVMAEAKAWIPGVPLTRGRIIGLSCGCSAAATALDIMVAQFWVFPIPFLTVLGGPVLLTIVAVALVCVVGFKTLREIEDGAFHLERYLTLLSTQTSTMTIYPAYHALFVVSPISIQRLLVVLLPGVSLALKNVMVAHGSHLEDRLPEVVVFSIDFFDAMYAVLCMRSANSLAMSAISVVVNCLLLTLSLKGMERRAAFARSFWMAENAQDATAPKLDSRRKLSPLLVALKLIETPGQLDQADLRQIRLFSGEKLTLSMENSAILNALAARTIYSTERRVSKMVVSVAQLKARYAMATIAGPTRPATDFAMPRGKLFQRLLLAVPSVGGRLSTRFEKLGRNRVRTTDAIQCTNKGTITNRVNTAENIDPDAFHPTPPTFVRAFTPPKVGQVLDTSFKLRSLVLPQSSVISDVLLASRKQNTRVVNQTLQLLFNNEYLGLIAYTQCIIPVMYMVYMAALQTLPNRVFYPEARNVHDATLFVDRMLVIVLSAAFQFVSLLALHTIVASRFSVSTLYQIAFVLETHAALIQGKVASCFIFAVGFPLEHYGSDFSFRFAWMQRETP